MRVSLRRVEPEDEPFLRRVYASTRMDELAPTGWTDAQKSAFCDLQFDAQTRDYTSRATNLTYDVILVDDEMAGRLWVSREPGRIGVFDVALLPEFRGRGAGETLLLEVLAEAQRDGATVTIHVERNNPARRLYDRLGFRQVEEGDVYHRLEWSATAVS